MLQHIGKSFIRPNWVFRNVNLTLQTGDRIALLGNNGSGKSSLLQIISGHLTASEGEVIYTDGHKQIEANDCYQYMTYVSPVLELIEEFTLQEFFDFHFSIKKQLLPIPEILSYIGLSGVSQRKIESFSSGMKQRVKLAQALCADTPIVLLDEPCSNLDQDGFDLYHRMIGDFAAHKIVVVASNDVNEYTFCQQQIDVRQYK